MVNLNLFPWREHKRVYQARIIKKSFLIAISLMIMNVILMHLVLVKREGFLQVRIDKLSRELAQYREQKRKQVELQHSFLVHAMGSNQSHHRMMSKLFNQSSAATMLGVCFTQIEHSKKSILFEGRASSAEELTEFLRYWNTEDLFSEMHINSIVRQANGFVNFGFQAFERNN